MAVGNPADNSDSASYDNVEASNGDVDKRAGIGWTTGAHTALPVPVFAIGRGAENFAGFYDNTDIPKKIIKITEL